MNPKTRQRVMRGFLGSLLQSDLTNSEVRQVAEELAFGSFGKDLAEYILEVIQVGDVSHHRDVSRYDDYDKSISNFSMAWEIIRRRKLSRKEIVQLMMLASPALKPRQFETQKTIRDMVESYMSTAPTSDSTRFLNILAGEPADAYMKGIARRDRTR